MFCKFHNLHYHALLYYIEESYLVRLRASMVFRDATLSIWGVGLSQPWRVKWPVVSSAETQWKLARQVSRQVWWSSFGQKPVSTLLTRGKYFEERAQLCWGHFCGLPGQNFRFLEEKMKYYRFYEKTVKFIGKMWFVKKNILSFTPLKWQFTPKTM